MWRIGRIFILALLYQSARTQDGDSEYVDSEIPADWREYIGPDTLRSARSWSSSPWTPLFQGDIAGVNPEIAWTTRASLADQRNEQYRLWPNRFVPFELSLALKESDRQAIRIALDELTRRTCVRFIPRKYEDDYVLIVPGVSCFSFVGKQGGRQIVSISEECKAEKGRMQHLFLHVLGMNHEQARGDRGNFIWINKKNIGSDAYAQSAFQRYGPFLSIKPYDYESVMHYGWNDYALSKNFPTVVPKNKGFTLGQRTGMSQIDADFINILYSCTNVPNLSILDISPDNFTEWKQLCDGKSDAPEGWDENPNVCLTLCDKLDVELFGGKVLFNDPDTQRCLSKPTLCTRKKNSIRDPEYCRRFCKEGGYLPLPPSNQCIHFSKLCNGIYDAADGSDEFPENCRKNCHAPEGELVSLQPSGRCVMKAWLCDGVQENDLDETENPKVCRKHCKDDGFFPVPATFQCLHWKSLCDGYSDTVSGWDEDQENCQRACAKADNGKGELISIPGTGRCMRKRSLCDGIKESPDLDVTETQGVCEQLCQGSLYLPAADTKQCIRATDLCDGKQDTRNGWDEVKGNCVKNCKFMNTEKNLIINPRTKRCVEIIENVVEAEGLDNVVPENTL